MMMMMVYRICREEAEKRNIWVAWLNLEAEYGEPHDEAVMKLFHRALPYNDPKKLYFSLLEVLQKAKLVCTPDPDSIDCLVATSYWSSIIPLILYILHLQETVLQETLKAVMRRFSGSCKAWLAQIRQSIGRKELDSAQKLLERALSSLPQRKHIKVHHAPSSLLFDLTEACGSASKLLELPRRILL